MVNYLKKEDHELIGGSGHPMVAEGREALTPEEKIAVKEIMRRNDKALRILAEM